MTPEYKIIRSGRRTLSLEITADGEALVRAPARVPEERICDFVIKHAGWIEKKRVSAVKRKAMCAERGEAELRAEAQACLPGLTSDFARRMGLYPAYVKITSAEKRFGSCNSDGGICYSYRLMLYPPEAREYVVVHELAHIKHRNHGKGFYSLIEKFLPDYRERIKLLKD